MCVRVLMHVQNADWQGQKVFAPMSHRSRRRMARPRVSPSFLACFVPLFIRFFCFVFLPKGGKQFSLCRGLLVHCRDWLFSIAAASVSFRLVGGHLLSRSHVLSVMCIDLLYIFLLKLLLLLLFLSSID